MKISPELKKLLRQEILLLGQSFDESDEKIEETIHKIWLTDDYGSQRKLANEHESLKGVLYNFDEFNIKKITYTDEAIDEIFRDD